MRAIPSLLLLVLLADPSAAQALRLDGASLTQVDAVLDPLGMLRLRGSGAAEPVEFAVRFDELLFPMPGTYALATGTTEGLRVARRQGEEWVALVDGEAVVEAFSADRVAVELAWGRTEGAAGQRLQVDLAPRLARSEEPQVLGAPAVGDVLEPVDRPDHEDLVFCAVGGTGTGLPGAARTIADIAELAPTGPLDFVLLLGNSLSPRGVQSMTDAQWQTGFEQAWDREAFPGVFYAVPGRWDRRGRVHSLVEYGVMNDRWTMPSTYSYHFEEHSHGKVIDFISIDTDAVSGSMGLGPNRHAIRMATWLMGESKADWKIVFGHHAMQSGALQWNKEQRRDFNQRIGWRMKEAGVDLYISGADHFLELREPQDGTTHLIVGAGGGPEVASTVRADERTMFAHTGGGFAWFRFDGRHLELSLRGTGGEVLYVHRFEK